MRPRTWGRATAALVLALSLAPPAASAPVQNHTLTNGTVDLTFRQQGTVPGRSNLWLTSIESSGGQEVLFEKGRPIWRVRAVLDPRQPTLEPYAMDVVPADLPLSVQQIATGGISKLIATWGPATVAAPAGSPSADPTLRVVATWTLKAGADKATTKVQVDITNGGATDYRLWTARYPRLAVACLDGDGDGSDRLALGRNGGVLYGDPIHYLDPNANGPLVLTKDPENTNLLVSPDSIEPGTLSVPVSTYYDAATELGLYHANNDKEGYFKAIYWTQEPNLGADGALLVETLQYVDGDIYDAQSYTSPYAVEIAALDRGDWIGAAQKYRDLWRTFPFYPGPIGSPLNTLVSDDFKDVPITLWLNSGNGYCPNDPNLGFDLVQSQADLDALHLFMGVPFPFVYLNRFPVDVPHEVSLAGFTPSGTPAMADVGALVSYAESQGHRTVIHTMTEKVFLASTTHFACSLFAQCDYCGVNLTGFDDPDVIPMQGENALIRTPGGGATQAPCSRGAALPAAQGGTIGVDWPAWFADLNAEFSNTLGSTGGLGWTSPNPTSGWCFSEHHDHPPGFGKFLAQGWLDLLADTAAAATTTDRFARTMETSVAFFSQEAAVQNTWNFDLGQDFNHFSGEPGDVSSYMEYHDAPVWRIPMLPMAIDNAAYASVYFPQTLSYPYAAPYEPNPIYQIFEPYPALTGALACWSMAERVLSYQSQVYLNNGAMVPIADVLNPGQDDAKNAAGDMFEYYRGLASFLLGSQPAPLVDFHNGSLERAPVIAVGGSSGFAIDFATINAHLPGLDLLMGPGGFNLPGPPDIDMAKHQPVRQLLGFNDFYGAIWLPVVPEVDPTYLPNGMYRHHDGESLALLISNPWGVEHLNETTGDRTPVNPFTFDYAAPTSSPSTAYAYSFSFDPADYAGFPGSYEVGLAVYDVDGQLVQQSAFAPASGVTVFNGSLAPFESAAWVFRDI